MYSISNIIIQASVNGLGTAVAAAWTVTGKFDGIYWVTSNSFGMALCTFVGQCYGAGDIARMKKGARLWLLFDLGISAVVSVVLLTLAPWGFRLFTQDAAVIDYSIDDVLRRADEDMYRDKHELKSKMGVQPAGISVPTASE
jgi:Na+-driven multidrug efflux pump